MPLTPPPPEVVLVDVPEQVDAALERVGGPVVGVDVERSDAGAYFRRAALVQVGIAERCVLLDGVALAALPGLDRFLDDRRLAVLHAVENDLEPLAAKGVHPDRIADTAVAAALLGRPTGLRDLLAAVLDLELDGDKARFQRADWEARPLDTALASYAAGDVVHLPELWAALAAELEQRGRRPWYEQELAAILERAREATRDWTRVRGAGRLEPGQRAVLRALWEERERLARTHDLAPNHLLHDDVLRQLAVDPPDAPEALVQRSPTRRSLLRRHAEELFAALERGRRARSEPHARGEPLSTRDRARFDALRRARSRVAAGLGLDPGVLCPSRQLERVLTGRPADATELCQLAQLRPWQAEQLGDALWEAYRRASERTPSTSATSSG